MTHPADDSDAPQLIADCEAREERLTDWERGFIDSIQRQMVDGHRLSEKQLARLDEIWGRATAKG